MGQIKKMSFHRIYSAKEIPFSNYGTHGIHSYTAKLIPQIPRYFIEKYSKKGDVVLDPFCGSGTTLLEAKLLFRNGIGIDINPLAVLISESKTTPIDIAELKLASQSVLKKLKTRNGIERLTFPNIDYWFSGTAKRKLLRVKSSIQVFKEMHDESIHKFLLVCLSSIIRKSSFADPRMAKTYKSKRVMEKLQNGWLPNPFKYFEEALEKNIKRIECFSDRLKESPSYVKVFPGDAKEMSEILKANGIKRADFLITSPPYINAQDYFRSYKFELWWLELATPEQVKELKRRCLGTECISSRDHDSPPKTRYLTLKSILKEMWKIDKRSSYIVHRYFENMNDVFRESNKVLKKGGHFCLITGNNTICGINIPTWKILTHIAKENGFKLVEIVRDEIRNRLLPPNRNHNGGIIKEEWITVFKKMEQEQKNES